MNMSSIDSADLVISPRNKDQRQSLRENIFMNQYKEDSMTDSQSYNQGYRKRKELFQFSIGEMQKKEADNQIEQEDSQGSEDENEREKDNQNIRSSFNKGSQTPSHPQLMTKLDQRQKQILEQEDIGQKDKDQIIKQSQHLQKRGKKMIEKLERPRNSSNFSIPNPGFSMTKKKESYRNPKEVWAHSFLKIIALVNRFRFRLKQSTHFFKPDKLSQYQLNLISDQCVPGSTQKSSNLDNYQLYQRKSYYKINKKYIKLFKKCKSSISVITKSKFCKTIVNGFRYINKIVPIFHSHHLLHLMWDLLIFIISIFIMIEIPFDMGFNNGYSNNEEIQKNVEYNQLIISIFMITDMVVQLNTSYFEFGILINDRLQIVTNYFQEYFLLDLISIVLINYYQHDQTLIQIILFLLFFIKLLDNKQSFQHLGNQIHLHIKLSSLNDLLVLLAKVLYFNHLFACIIHWVAIKETKAGQNNWLIKNQILDADLLQRYITSFYFGTVTMCTVGYGDIVPITTIERFCMIILTLFSSAMFGYTLNSIGYILIELGQRERTNKQDLAEMKKYLKEHNVQPLLQNQAIQYAQFVQNEGLNSHNETKGQSLNMLSKQMQLTILKSIFYSKLAQIPFFNNNFSQLFLEQLAVRVKERTLGPGDMLTKNGEKCDPEIFIVGSGKLEIYVLQLVEKEEKKITFQSITQDEYFGQLQFFTNSSNSKFSIKSIGISTIFSITLHDFLLTLSQSSEIDKETFQFMKDMCIFCKKYDIIDIGCFSCQAHDHIATQCPFLVYGGDRQQMIKQINQEDFQFRQSYVRKRVKTRQLVNFRINSMIALKFQQNYQQYINIYRDVYFLDEEDGFQDLTDPQDMLLRQLGHDPQEQDIDLSLVFSVTNEFKQRRGSCLEDNFISQSQTLELQQANDIVLQMESNKLFKRNNITGSSDSQGEEEKVDQRKSIIKLRREKSFDLPPIIISDDRLAPPERSTQKVHFDRQMMRGLSFLEMQKKLVAHSDISSGDTFNNLKIIEEESEKNRDIMKLSYQREQTDILLETEQKILKQNEKEENLLGMIKDINSNLSQVLLMSQNQIRSPNPRSGNTLIRTDTVNSAGNIKTLDTSPENTVNQGNEHFSTNEDMDKVKCFDIYFPQSNIDNFKNIIKEKKVGHDQSIYHQLYTKRKTMGKKRSVQRPNDNNLDNDEILDPSGDIAVDQHDSSIKKDDLDMVSSFQSQQIEMQN